MLLLLLDWKKRESERKRREEREIEEEERKKKERERDRRRAVNINSVNQMSSFMALFLSLLFQSDSVFKKERGGNTQLVWYPQNDFPATKRVRNSEGEFYKREREREMVRKRSKGKEMEEKGKKMCFYSFMLKNVSFPFFILPSSILDDDKRGCNLRSLSSS